MRYLKLDMLSSDIDSEVESHFPFMSFIEIDDVGYEQRRVNFHRENAGLEEDYKISFIDKQGSYLGAWLPEHSWRSENYSKTGILNVNEYQSEPGFSLNFTIEISKDDFEKVWQIVVEKYLLEKCLVMRDKENEPLIDFNNLPTHFNKEQLEYLEEVYQENENHDFFTWITKEHMQQILDYIAKKQ